MSALFPTLGNPITQALTARGINPRAFRLSLISLLARDAAFASCMQVCFRRRISSQLKQPGMSSTWFLKGAPSASGA